MVILSDDEARDLVKTILEAIEVAEEGTQVVLRGRLRPPTGAT